MAIKTGGHGHMPAGTTGSDALTCTAVSERRMESSPRHSAASTVFCDACSARASSVTPENPFSEATATIRIQ